ncbi:MAG: hypothetical protein IPI68_05295 [Chitinophagaceae bacterium]|nr:hypothetical protein [Chitinophagaceae bacterium]
MRRIIIFLFITMGVMACKDKKQSPATDATQQKTEELVQNSGKDSTEIRKVITDFYSWYNTNYTKFQVYDLYSGIKKDDTPPYKINWKEVEKYQDFIRSSVPQLGEEFITNQKRFFQQCDSAFKVDVKDDIPYGFDYDWYTNSQEDSQYLIDEMNKATSWLITRTGDYAKVDVKGNFENNGKKEETTIITITMKPENGQWKIAKIGNE